MYEGCVDATTAAIFCSVESMSDDYPVGDEDEPCDDDHGNSEEDSSGMALDSFDDSLDDNSDMPYEDDGSAGMPFEDDDPDSALFRREYDDKGLAVRGPNVMGAGVFDFSRVPARGTPQLEWNCRSTFQHHVMPLVVSVSLSQDSGPKRRLLSRGLESFSFREGVRRAAAALRRSP